LFFNVVIFLVFRLLYFLFLLIIHDGVFVFKSNNSITRGFIQFGESGGLFRRELIGFFMALSHLRCLIGSTAF
jgi:hypothetical protein